MTVGSASSTATPFTATGRCDGEARVARDMAALVPLLRGLLPGVRALFLVGGYGRGEGAILAGAGGPRPFNDYDLLAVFDRLPGRRRRGLRRRLVGAAPRLAEAAGVPVDVGLQDREGLRSEPPSILWYEMAAGHRLLWGDPDVEFPGFDPAQLPLDEGVLLLTNRGSALLMRDVDRPASGPRVSTAEVVDAMKLALAWGDALLLARGRYTVSYVDRGSRLAELDGDLGPFPDELRELYARAVAFKLEPDATVLDAERGGAIVQRVRELHATFLHWFEAHRLGAPIGGWTEYARPSRRKLMQASSSPRWLIKHALRLGLPRDGDNARLHARPTYERLVSVLPLLLFGRDAVAAELAVRLLNAPACGREHWHAAARRYLQLWK